MKQLADVLLNQGATTFETSSKVFLKIFDKREDKMSYKKITALPKTAEEITGVAGCRAFTLKLGHFVPDLIYRPEMNELALAGKRIEIEPLKNPTDNFYENYDYRSVMTYSNNDQYYWRKEWLKDIRSEKEQLNNSKKEKELLTLDQIWDSTYF